MSSREGPSLSSCMPSLEAVQLTCHELHENLSTLWPCEKQFVAVLGRTGCGKSTLLNLLLSMICASGETYSQGIRADSARAVLRDTARVHGGSTSGASSTALLEAEDVSESVLGMSSEARSIAYMRDDLMVGEQLSFKGLLGICCAQDRQSYMSKHIPHYDTHPFLLQNGRMGDAGTTKVTAIEYGPKFVGHIRWMTKKKMRKKLKDLRQLLDNRDRATEHEQSLAELKEFWLCVRQLVDLPLSAEKPTEEQIHRVIDVLGNKKGLLDKEEVIEMGTTKGCTLDRVFVREGVKEKLCQQLGKLIEDLRIEVPVSSFEGGISLLDVPGTNDPRVLHQRETRDAIDRTSLILLVLDKSVIDVQTQESLVESLLLERMLMDETARCSLVVVGIAEKDNKKGQSPKDLVAGFDPKGSIMKILKKIFLKIASRLCRSKRIEKEDAFNRIESLFASSICLIPVLPFLCASLQLSLSNAQLHQIYCESEGKKCCPLSMSREEIRQRCIETNVPQLLEKVHIVRVPPKLEDLRHFMTTTMDGLSRLTQQYVPDTSYVKFLKREQDQAVSVVAENVCVQGYSDNYLNTQLMEDMLDKCSDECRLGPDDIQDISNTVGEELLSQLQTGRFSLGPFIVRGFRPDVIGQKANDLIQTIDGDSQRFMELAYARLISLRGDEARIDATFEKVGECLPMAVGLYVQLLNTWDLSLRRLRAKCFCGGMDGGLLGQVREALRKAYYGGLKHLSKKLKQRSSSGNFRETLQIVLESNEIGLYAAKTAKMEVKKAINVFWKNLLELTNTEMQFLWKSWQKDIKKLRESALNFVHAHRKEVPGNPGAREKMEAGEDRLRLFQETMKGKMQELESLKKLLDDPLSQTHRFFDYGYSLLQSDSYFCSASVVSNAGQDSSVDAMGQNRYDVVPMLRDQGIERGATMPQCCVESMHCSDNQVMKEDETQDFMGANPSGVAGGANMKRPGSFNRSGRKAQMLSEAESHKLQKRESNANNRSRK